MEPLSRRDILLAGAAGLWPGPTRAQSHQPFRSLIVVWLGGGPSQLETWDPHPGRRIGGLTKAIPTRTRGLQFSEFFPRLADQSHRLSVIRSLTSLEGDHRRGSYAAKTGYRMNPSVTHPSLTGLNAWHHRSRDLALPRHVSLGPGPWPARGGDLGAQFDAFRLKKPGENLGNLQPNADPIRHQARLKHLHFLEDSSRTPQAASIDQTLHQWTTRRALAMMTPETFSTFSLQEEPPSIREAYGDHRFGKACLLARRLIDRKVPAVEVTLSGFDSHTGNHETHTELCPVVDQGLSALLADLSARDQLRHTVVLCLGEFGRTPKINPAEGRDHWPHGFSCLIAGGGIRPGQVVGATDPEGRIRHPRDPVPLERLAATVLAALGLDPTETFATSTGRPIRLSGGRPVKKLLL